MIAARTTSLLASTAAALLLGGLALASTGCETNETYASDRVERRSMTTDPFGGARLMTGNDFRESKASDTASGGDFFAPPKRQ